MAHGVLSTFSSAVTTANAERFGAWTLAGGGNKITVIAACNGGTTTAANVRLAIGGRKVSPIYIVTQQTTRVVAVFELLKHELPGAAADGLTVSGSQNVRLYWPSATRLHIVGVELSDSRQRYTPTGDIYPATSTSAQNANLTGSSPTANGILLLMSWYAGTSSWTMDSSQTKIGTDNQQTTFLAVGAYKTGLSSGSQASDVSVPGAAAAIGQVAVFLAQDSQDLSSLSPADGDTGVSTSPSLALTMSATAVQGTGSLRVYETVAPSASAAVDDGQTSSNSTGTGSTAFTADLSALGSLAGKRLVIGLAHDGGASVLTDDGTASPWHGAIRGTGLLLVWRDCDGTEPSSYGFTANPAEGICARARIISGHDTTKPPVFSIAEGNSSAPNPPAVTFPWGSDPTLVTVFGRFDGGATASAYPSGYTGTGTLATSHATAGDRAAMGWCHLGGITAGSADPGTFTITAGELWTVVTGAHPPADPSVLVDTIDVTSAVFASTTATFSASGLAGSTAHHFKLDAGAIEDFEGISGRTTWNVTTGASSADPLELDDLTPTAVAASVATLAPLALTPSAVAPSAVALATQDLTPAVEAPSSAALVTAALTAATVAPAQADLVAAALTPVSEGASAANLAPVALVASEVAPAAAGLQVADLSAGAVSPTVAALVTASLVPSEVAASDAPTGLVTDNLVPTQVAPSTADLVAQELAPAVVAATAVTLVTIDLVPLEVAPASAVNALELSDLSPSEIAASVAELLSAALAASTVEPTVAALALADLVPVEVLPSLIGEQPDPIPALTATWAPGRVLVATHAPGLRLSATWSSSQ